MSDESPGWDAIDDALASIYGDDREPEAHFGTMIPWTLGGPDPIHGISAFARSDEHGAFWHIITYGFSELWDKESDDPEVSGWGFELSIRVARQPTDDQPPNWALSFLQNLGRYVFGSGNVFAAGHYMNINGPIAIGADTAIRAIAFAPDPELPASIDTPNGKLAFLHVIGITLDEHEAMQDWTTDGVLQLLAARDPMLRTDLARTSILADPNAAAAVQAGIERDGSSQGSMYLQSFAWRADGDAVVLQLGAHHVDSLRRLLKGRLPFQRDFWVLAGDIAWWAVPGEQDAWEELDGGVKTTISAATAQHLLDALQPQRGRYGRAPLLFDIVPTEITDANGQVVEVIG